MEREKQLSLLRLQTTLYHSSFYASHAFGLGLRPTNQTTQYDGLVTSQRPSYTARSEGSNVYGVLTRERCLADPPAGNPSLAVTASVPPHGNQWCHRH